MLKVDAGARFVLSYESCLEKDKKSSGRLCRVDFWVRIYHSWVKVKC